MYLTTRKLTLNSTGGLQWALDITEKVNQITGAGTALWGRVWSPGFGELTWGTWHADLAAAEAFGQKIEADSGYQELAAAGREHITGTIDDGLLENVAGDPDPQREISYLNGVEAVIAAGNIARGMVTGVEIAEKAAAVTGLPTMFVRSLTGPYGAVGWLTGYTDVTEMEAANAKLGGDDGWIQYLDTTEGSFVEDAAVTQSAIYRKLA